jgi:hypothetical protein
MGGEVGAGAHVRRYKGADRTGDAASLADMLIAYLNETSCPASLIEVLLNGRRAHLQGQCRQNQPKKPLALDHPLVETSVIAVLRVDS